ncbi:MAG: class I SAM-dependent methyltransferase [Phycisphaeraceae bacterium]
MDRRLEPEVMADPAEAAEYDAADFSIPNAAFIERLVELGAGGVMLDVGTGNGLIPPLVAQRIPRSRILGVDLSQAMLDVAERHRRESREQHRITFQPADAAALPFDDGAFDAVFSNTILHHLPTPRAEQMLVECWRVLRTGGVLLIRDLFRPRDEDEVESLVELHAGDQSPHARQLFRQSLQAAFTPDELRKMIGDLKIPAQVVIDTDRHASIQTSQKTSGGRSRLSTHANHRSYRPKCWIADMISRIPASFDPLLIEPAVANFRPLPPRA